jgi:CheY-like chemotaxis protein
MTLADPGQVENALLNLAINARDAMPQGGKLIIETSRTKLDAYEVAAFPRVQTREYVTLSVTDTGTGMSPEVLQRAFEPFYTTKGPGVGSGLGLSTIYGFVEQSGGHVQLYSELGIGTTVRVHLPALRDAATVASDFAKPAPSPSAGETILVVEDDPRVRRVTVRRLTELGYRVIEADGGPAALAVLQRSEPIELLFTDVVMAGGMSGFDLVQQARQLRPELRVLFTSGYADPASLKGSQQVHNAGWLGKPHSFDELKARLRELLDH